MANSNNSKSKNQNLKLLINLRSVLVLVICLTGISVMYQLPLIQFSILIITFILLLIFRPTAKARARLLNRISRISRIILIIFIFQLLFRRSGNQLWEFGFIKITDLGLNYALASSLRFFIIILVAGLLMDYPFQDYLIALNAWKIPYEIAFIVAATIHFLPIFRTTFKNKMEALALRGISINKISISQRIKTFRILLLPIIATALYNIQYRAISLEMRAFRLYPDRTYLHHKKLNFIDYFIIFLSIFLTIVIIFHLSV